MTHHGLWGGEVFTSGQIARLCAVAMRTVSKWFDEGFLRGFRLPNGNHQDRRVTREDLIDFLVRHGMTHALAKLNGNRPVNPVFLLGVPERLVTHLVHHAPVHVAVSAPSESFLAVGYRLARLETKHALLVLDAAAVGKGEAFAAAAFLSKESPRLRLMGLASEFEATAMPGPWFDAGFRTVLSHPVSNDLFLKTILEVLDARAHDRPTAPGGAVG